MLSGVLCQSQRGVAVTALSPPSATHPCPVRPLPLRLALYRSTRRVLIGVRACSPSLLAFALSLFPSAFFALDSRLLVRCFCLLFSKALSSDCIAICVAPHLPQQRGLELKLRDDVSKSLELGGHSANTKTYCMSSGAYAFSLEIFLSFIYLVLILHPTERSYSYFQLLVLATVLKPP